MATLTDLTVKLTLQYKPSLTATILGSNWIFVGFFLSTTRGVQRLALTTPLKWRVACKVLTLTGMGGEKKFLFGI